MGKSDDCRSQDEIKEGMLICKCGKKAAVALNGQWFCPKCFNADNLDIVKIVKQSIKGAKKATSPPQNPPTSESL